MNLDERLSTLADRIDRLGKKTNLRAAYRAGVVYGSLMESDFGDWNRPFTKAMTENFENWLTEHPEMLK